MFTRPFLPFRVRPLQTVKPRSATPQAIDILAALETIKPLSVKAERRTVKAAPVSATSRTRVAVRGSTRIA